MDKFPKSRMGLLLVLAASILYLAAATSEEVKTTALRLASVLLFVAGMSVTVNLRPDYHAALSLVPWNSLLLAAAFSFSVGAVLVLAGGRLSLEMGPATLAALGAVTANILNNIPAYLLLEPATSTPQHTLALLIGVNCGPIVTPWASLATLLWHDQLRRSGIEIPWRTVAAKGAILAPFAVSVPLAALSFVS